MTNPGKSHPIVDLVFGHLQELPQGSPEKLVLKETARQPLHDAFNAMEADKARLDALLELIVWGQFMATLGAPSVLSDLRTLLLDCSSLQGSKISGSNDQARKALEFLGRAAPSAAPSAGGTAGTKWWELNKK